MSFANMRNSRGNAMAALTQELTKVNQKGGGGSSDDRYWQPTVDKEGNGSAIIRFLPAPDGETVPFIRMWDHGFQGPGGWYIEKSLTTLGKEDPLGEYNGTLWNSGNDEDKETARKQKRRLSFISNIYVVQDKANPENEGKVFLYKYGKKIFDKLNDLMNPEFEDEKATNPFDLWEGANFRLRIRKFEGYRNYDKSDFDKPSPIKADDDEMEMIWKQEYPLLPIIDPKEFKDYDTLKARLEKVLGHSVDGSSSAKKRVEDDYSSSAPSFKERSSSPAKEKEAYTPPFDTDDAEDDLDFFKKLREDD